MTRTELQMMVDDLTNKVGMEAAEAARALARDRVALLEAQDKLVARHNAEMARKDAELVTLKDKLAAAEKRAASAEAGQVLLRSELNCSTDADKKTLAGVRIGMKTERPGDRELVAAGKPAELLREYNAIKDPRERETFRQTNAAALGLKR